MTQPPSDSTSSPSLASLAAAPDAVTLPELWAALSPDDRRRAIALAIRADRSVRPTLVALLRSTPRFRAFRPQAFDSWSPERFADALKGPKSLSAEAMRAALIALHVGDRGTMLGAFLDSLGVPHEQGVIEELPDDFGPDEATLARAADDLAARFPRDEVVTYFLTLLVLEPEPWSGLAPWLARQGAAG